MSHQVRFALPLQRPDSESRLQRSLMSMQVLAVQHGTCLDRCDWLAAEEPLEIRVESPG
jgi:hypothetical protein